jgi:HD-GYP domain-containing protein (c-di-GMP phosphodiesterase class II)
MGGGVLRLADLLAGLSRLADLGFGLQAGEALRASALAAGLARSMDLDDEDVRAAIYTALLLHLGCVGYARETARLFGDELLMGAASARTNLADPRDVITTFLPSLTRGRSPLERTRLVLNSLTRGVRHGEAFATTACEVGRDVARRLRLPEEVQRSIYRSYEWWDGGGVPDGLRGEDIPVGARVAVLTTVAVTFDVAGGTELAVEAVREQRGGILDPGIAEHFIRRAAELFGEVHAHDPHQLVLDAEPAPVVSVLDPHLREVASVFGDIADLKTPYTHGHSRGVAALAGDAGERLDLRGSDLADLTLAGHLHEVGRVAVSSAVWEKRGPLDDHEWEQVRLHAYHSERILGGSRLLASLVPLVGRHHERLDGSGYHRGCTRSELPAPARVLAASDAYHAMTERRPHRAALTPDQAEQQLLDDARSGRLDPDAVGAVLAAAGHDAPAARRAPPAGLTDREVQVLGLVAEGRTNREIGELLVVSRRTAEVRRGVQDQERNDHPGDPGERSSSEEGDVDELRPRQQDPSEKRQDDRLHDRERPEGAGERPGFRGSLASEDRVPVRRPQRESELEERDTADQDSSSGGSGLGGVHRCGPSAVGRSCRGSLFPPSPLRQGTKP